MKWQGMSGVGGLGKGLWITVLSGVLMLALTGCGVPRSQSPLGGRPVALNPREWEGVWEDPSGTPVLVRVVDAGTGQLEVAIPGKGEAGFKMDRFEVRLREEGGVTLLSARGVGDAVADGYAYGRLVRQGGSGVIVAWGSMGGARELAAQGVAGAEVRAPEPGGSDRGSVVFTNGYERLAGRLVAPDGWRWFSVDEAWILVRRKEGLD